MSKRYSPPPRCIKGSVAGLRVILVRRAVAVRLVLAVDSPYGMQGSETRWEARQECSLPHGGRLRHISRWCLNETPSPLSESLGKMGKAIGVGCNRYAEESRCRMMARKTDSLHFPNQLVCLTSSGPDEAISIATPSSTLCMLPYIRTMSKVCSCNFDG